MKKFFPIIAIIVLLAVGGYFYFNKKGTNTGLNQSREKQGAENVITSIKDAIAKSLPIKCEYPDDKGNTVTSYIKGEEIRMIGYTTETGTQGNTLIKGNKMYAWDEQTKKGTIISLYQEDIRATDEQEQSEEVPDQKAETIENIEKYKDYCQVTVINDSIFAVPADIEFTDLDQQMKDAGVDIQKMMEQYQQ